jgi:GNAT superfamily N-acetyltransferase
MTTLQSSPPRDSTATATPQVHLLGPKEMAGFCSMARESGLPGLAHPGRIVTTPGCLMLLAVDSGELLGCAGLRLDVVHSFIHDGRVRELPLPNVYLFGAYVHPQARGRGVGGLLYRRRLALAELVDNGITIVEMLGDGSPNSVHPRTGPGLRFHLGAGFHPIGYSPDPDGGVVLARAEVHT